MDGEKQLCIRWREAGVAIEREPVRRGFGSDILERSIPHVLHGRFERTLHHDGIECLIVFPLASRPEVGDRIGTEPGE
jgi:hypothetical protein